MISASVVQGTILLALKEEGVHISQRDNSIDQTAFDNFYLLLGLKILDQMNHLDLFQSEFMQVTTQKKALVSLADFLHWDLDMRDIALFILLEILILFNTSMLFFWASCRS